jgi:carotenoid cleavage dioxygenase
VTNPYLEGHFAPLQQEYTLTDLEVAGAIPDYLDGRYVRNGPNAIGALDPLRHHWYMADGMVHGIRIRDGRAEWYRNRWVRGPHAAKALGERSRIRHCGTLPFGPNSAVIRHAGKTFAVMEAGIAAYELTDELETVGTFDFDGTLTGGYTAHPKLDPETGELHGVSHSMFRGNRIQYSVIGVDGRARRTVDIEVPGDPLMDNFSLTERHVVFYDLPVSFDARRAAALTMLPGLRLPARLVLSALVGRVRIPEPISARLPTKCYDHPFPYAWNPKRPARVGVMPRDGSNADVRWFDVEPCFVSHPLNAYDDGDTIVLDVVRHSKAYESNHLGPGEGPATLDRWTVDLAHGKVRESRFDDRGQEFPRVDERLVGRRHRYGYAPVGETDFGDTLLKHDFLRNSTQSRCFGTEKQVSEFIFHPSAPDAAEDDGVLMGYVYDRSTGRSELAILDAQTLEHIASIKLPHRVPAGMHGTWLPTDK